MPDSCDTLESNDSKGFPSHVGFEPPCAQGAKSDVTSTCARMFLVRSCVKNQLFVLGYDQLHSLVSCILE
jgi:hypothetical protein